MFLKALDQTGMLKELQGKGPFIVFAPTDEAFKKLGGATLKWLFDDTQRLARVVRYHIIVEPAARMNTLSQKSVTLLAAVGGISPQKVGNVQVVKSIPGSNGVIHVVDSVLMPVAPPEPPKPPDLDTSEVWLPYPAGSVLPIGDADLVPGLPLMRKGVVTLKAVLTKSKVQINTARTVCLEEGGEVACVAPAGPVAGLTDKALPDIARSGVIIGTLIFEGKGLDRRTKLEPGVPYALRLRSLGSNEPSVVEVVDNKDLVVETLKQVIRVDNLGEIPTAAISYGTKYCKVWGYCFPCDYLGPFAPYPDQYTCETAG